MKYSYLIENEDLRIACDLYFSSHKLLVVILSIIYYFFGNVFTTKNGILNLCVLLFALNKTKKIYDDLGIDEYIFDNTMKDINIWCEDSNVYGIENTKWIRNHITLKLFKIGDLQFQFYKANNHLLLNKLPFEKGDNLIYIHIPRGAKINQQSALKSINEFEKFCYEYFSKYEYEYYFCESWLLYSKNNEFMNLSSNIISFSNLFTISYDINNPIQTINRVFGFNFNSYNDIKNYRCYTSLQNNIIEYVNNGGTLGEGVGYLKRSK